MNPRPHTRLALFDLDGTLIDGNSWQGFHGWCLRRNPAWAAPMLRDLLARSLRLCDGPGLRARFLRRLRGRGRAEFSAMGEAFLEDWLRPRLRTGALAAIRRHANAGDRLVLATGSFDFLALPVARELGFADCLATRLLFEGDRFAGVIDGPELRDEVKRQAVLGMPGSADTDWGASAAYGDEEADRPMLALVGRPVYVGRKPVPAGLASLPGLVREAW